MNNSIKKSVVLLMTLVMAMSSFTGCKGDDGHKKDRDGDSHKNQTQEKDEEPLERNPVEVDENVFDNSVLGYTNFSVELLQNTYMDKNIMVSPLSVMGALGMTMNGASGNTLAQMESVFGMSLSDVNGLMYLYNENYLGEQLSQANAVYVNNADDYELQVPFRQSVMDYYGADIETGAFDDSMVDRINEFVSDNTNGRIPSIIDRLNPDDRMVLVNAVNFDATWRNTFETDDIYDREFYLDNGDEITVSMMYEEGYNNYICGDNETGFIKYYVGDYAFIALLPEEGMCMDEYLATLSGAELNEFICNGGSGNANIGLPAFESEYSDSIVEELSSMGMGDAFTGSADFSNMLTNGDGAAELYISDVIHKTYIKVDSEGTQAAAATAVIMTDGCSAITEEPIYVILNRPFVYAIVNTETNMPVFMGVYNGQEM